MSLLFSFVFGFRNRETLRVKRCFDSLAVQDFKDFEVIFTDFGSDPSVSSEIKKLCKQYPFVKYLYNEVRGFPWNRSHALNTGVRHSEGTYIIFGDVDLIYSRQFLSTVSKEASAKKTLYGEYYRLPEHFCEWDKLEGYDITRLQGFGAAGKGGVHIVAKEALNSIGSYDEFYCYWGVEDRDLNYRLTRIGLEEAWMNNQAPVFHQWHPETSDFYRSGFPLQWWEEMNLYFEQRKKDIIRNDDKWGVIYSAEDRPVLNDAVPLKTVNLNTDKKTGIRAKSDIIRNVYRELNELQNGERVRFYFLREQKCKLPEIPRTFNIYPVKIGSMSDWKGFEFEYEKLVDRYQMFSSRMNYFLPDEDLPYIFWKIIRNEKNFDYVISSDDSQLQWTFARK